MEKGETVGSEILWSKTSNVILGDLPHYVLQYSVLDDRAATWSQQISSLHCPVHLYCSGSPVPWLAGRSCLHIPSGKCFTWKIKMACLKFHTQTIENNLLSHAGSNFCRTCHSYPGAAFLWILRKLWHNPQVPAVEFLCVLCEVWTTLASVGLQQPYVAICECTCTCEKQRFAIYAKMPLFVLQIKADWLDLRSGLTVPMA